MATDPFRNQLQILKAMGFGFLEPVPAPPATTEEIPDPALAAEMRAPELSLEERILVLEEIAREIAACSACRLCNSRTNTVPGEGDPMAELMFIGEGPGENEDLQGRPFVGAAGDLLTKIIQAMQFRREEVYIANIVKCRPPGNRTPEKDEMDVCRPFLERQIDAIQPKAIVLLGKAALAGLLPEHFGAPITKLRGNWLSYRGIPVMPTFHPAYLLRSPQQKRFVWEDMKQVMRFLGKEVPGGG